MRRRWLVISVGFGVGLLLLAIAIPKRADEFAFLRLLKPEEIETWETTPGGAPYHARVFRFRQSVDAVKISVDANLKDYSPGGEAHTSGGHMYSFHGPNGRSLLLSNMYFSSHGAPTLPKPSWTPAAILQFRDTKPTWLERTMGGLRSRLGL